MVKKIAIVSAVAILLFSAAMVLAIPAEFKSFLEGRSNIKICVELKNSSKDDKVDMDRLKKLIEEAFASRKSHSFVVVSSPAEADLIMRGDITEYVWLDTDPVDQVWGVGPAAMDAATSDNYARIQAQVEMVDVKHNRVIWSEKVQANVTKHIMPKDASYELVYQRFIRSLMVELFRKRVT